MEALALKSEPDLPTADCGEVAFCGEKLFCDAQGGLFWPRQSLLVVSDLHLEKGAALAARGQMLPPYDTAATLERLANCIARWQPETVVSLGDSFHRDDSAHHLPDVYAKKITELAAGRKWVWITGNHDPSAPVHLGGESVQELRLGPFRFVHEQTRQALGEICGHLHPVAVVRQRGKRLRRRCFAGDGRRLMMPAFGAYTGGLNVLSEPFEGLFDLESLSVWMMSGQQIYNFGARQLYP